MSQPRQIVPGRYYLITRRCSERRFFLRPGEVTKGVFEFLLAEAAAYFAIEVVAWMAMSNHYHAVVRDPYGRLPHFLERFHLLVARTLNPRHKHWESFWAASEPTCVTHLVTPDDVFDKVVYTLANPVLGDLVDQVGDWPGASAYHRLGAGKKEVVRPGHFFRKDGAVRKAAQLEAVVPADFSGDGVSWAERVRAALTLIEESAREERRRTGRGVVGRTALMRASAQARPSTHEPRRKLRPNVACRDKQLRVAALRALKAFRRAYRRAKELFDSGVRDVMFPEGTWGPRWMGVNCAAPQHAT